MKIRIEPHLTRFEVIRQLKELIQAYNGSPKSEDSFSDYLYLQSLDPVRRFLLLAIPEDSLGEGVDYTQMINYWTSKFQSARGTIKIFDYLRDLGGVLGVTIGRGEPGDPDYVPPYYYDTTTLEVNFMEVEAVDINLFIKTGVEFFKALLYFQDLRDTYETLKLDLTSNIYINLMAGSKFYSSYIVTDEI